MMTKLQILEQRMHRAKNRLSTYASGRVYVRWMAWLARSSN